MAPRRPVISVTDGEAADRRTPALGSHLGSTERSAHALEKFLEG
jgi:hypothetical protein